MTNTKFLTLAALMAGAMTLPIAGARAAGYGSDSKASTDISSEFKKADMDKSGTLNQSEYNKMAGASGSFSSLDKNGDSVLTLSELETNTGATPTGMTPGASANTASSTAK